MIISVTSSKSLDELDQDFRKAVKRYRRLDTARQCWVCSKTVSLLDLEQFVTDTSYTKNTMRSGQQGRSRSARQHTAPKTLKIQTETLPQQRAASDRQYCCVQFRLPVWAV